MNLDREPREATLIVGCELAHRSVGGVDVQLLWRRSRNEVAVVYTDPRDKQSFTAVVPNDRAWDAFQHPNAYRPEPRSAHREHRRAADVARA